MDKHVEASILLETYGKLLTEKQRKILNYYYNDDLSLTEIAQNENISRQAVNDIIKKGENNLLEYENALHIVKKSQQNQKILEKVLEELDKIENNSKIVEEIKNSIKKIQ